MKAKLFAGILAAAVSTSAMAQESAPWLKVDGQINFDIRGSSNKDYERSIRTQDAELRFELLLREGIKAVVKAELEKSLGQNGVPFKDLDIDKVLEEAYIQIETDKLGLPRAIVTLGKHQMAFGQNYTELPMFKDSLLYNLSKQDEVIGFTVQIPTNTLKIVDSIAISMFETGAGDFAVSGDKGGSIKLTKQVTSQVQAQVSAMMKQNSTTNKDETRGSLGFVFKGKDGKTTVWAEGLIIHNNPTLAEETTIGGRAGASYKVGPGAVVFEYSYLSKQAHEVAVAYNMPVGQNLVLSPEVRHRFALVDGQADETIVGIRARLMFSAEMKNRKLKGN